jgi:hypothetical protein
MDVSVKTERSFCANVIARSDDPRDAERLWI